MTAHIALLRAVNLGSHNKVGMADLRTCLERQGFVGVRTLLQSGNVVLGGGRLRGAALERRLEETARAALGLDTPFIVRTRDEWDALVAANPFPREAADDPGHLLLFCLKDAPPADAESRVQAAASAWSLSTVFQFRPVPRLPSHRSRTVTVSFDWPTPSG